MANWTVLITSATGRQGDATISAPVALPDLPLQKLLALTRNPDSAAAKALAGNSPNKISVIRGDLDNSDAIFDSAGGQGAVWGVFSVQKALGGRCEFEE
ncbi:hypothetical protein V1517DRAFT_36317 [Lipomyces orientalis]|uniref:Uncharacterized protein n=1 Tax=Lipomyces orientalis TaxID=1233043 RepID=A0ACC3TU10_9ASCO